MLGRRVITLLVLCAVAKAWQRRAGLIVASPSAFKAHACRVGQRKGHGSHIHAGVFDLRPIDRHGTGKREVPAQKHLRRIVGFRRHAGEPGER